MDTPSITKSLIQAHGVRDAICYPTELGIFSVNVLTRRGQTFTANLETVDDLSELLDIIEDHTSEALSNKKYSLKFEIS